MQSLPQCVDDDVSAFVSSNHDDADDGAVVVADGWIRQPRPLKVVDAAQGQALGLIKRRYRKCSRRDGSPVFYSHFVICPKV